MEDWKPDKQKIEYDRKKDNESVLRSYRIKSGIPPAPPAPPKDHLTVNKKTGKISSESNAKETGVVIDLFTGKKLSVVEEVEIQHKLSLELTDGTDTEK